ncbi:dual specificity protein phosphatase 19 [Osmia lignaria lignaria]|uniref:dual specificity protein phosphatase 19 n=1 Tax=Osmia lignaria lignaria TaxID=1437193 RepID=UPI001478180E|nr:dual specificity protein phosphatase 19 [Osmia lignaria]
MSLESLIINKKLHLKSCKTVVTNMLGQRYEEIDGEKKELPAGVPFVVDNKPDFQISQIISGLFLSSQDPVVSKEILQEHDIHHILSIGINVTVKFNGIKYYNCDLLDLPESDLIVAVKRCYKIIHENRHENILVHCNAGVSRSPAIIISYLIISEKLSYSDAYAKVKKLRNYIKPNEGFVKQLKMLRSSSIFQ